MRAEEHVEDAVCVARTRLRSVHVKGQNSPCRTSSYIDSFVSGSCRYCSMMESVGYQRALGISLTARGGEDFRT